jgi:NTE family protein
VIERERLGIVLGGGDDDVIAWQAGVLAGLADAGLNLGEATTVVGTSAGCVTAARLASGADPSASADALVAGGGLALALPSQLHHALADGHARLAGIMTSPFGGSERERRRSAGQFALRWRGLLSSQAHAARQASLVDAATWPPSLRLVAADAESGERIVLDHRCGASVADALAAARATPGLVGPVRLGERLLLDGALSSATNTDVAEGADLVVVVTATPAEQPRGSLARLWNERLSDELTILYALGTDTVVIHPSRVAAEALAGDATGDRVEVLVREGREQGAEVAGTLRRLPRHAVSRARTLRFGPARAAYVR